MDWFFLLPTSNCACVPPFPPFPARSPSLPQWVGVWADGGLICMLVETGGKWGLGSLGGGQVGYWGSKTTASPLHPSAHRRIHAHRKPKIWIHQNLLGRGCSHSPQTVFVLQQQRPGHIPLVSPWLPDHVTTSAELHFTSGCH